MVTAGVRSEYYMKQKEQQVRVHLMPFFGDKALSEVTAGLVQEYRVHRATTNRDRRTGEPKRPARNTLHSEIVTLRQILKTANRKGWLVALPDMSAPNKKSGKVSHRAWFSPEEYKRLYQASRERAKHPKKERWRGAAENLHDYILFMVNTGLRPDEVLGLENRDSPSSPMTRRGNASSRSRSGASGVGYRKSMPGAVMPFRPPNDRNKGQPTDRLFPSFQRELFNTLLEELGLREDREGQQRTACSLHHTYYLPAADGGRRHLSGRQELPHQRGDDPDLLRLAHRLHARRLGDQCAQAQAGQTAGPEGEGDGRRLSLALAIRNGLAIQPARPSGRGGTGRRNGLKPTIECAGGNPGRRTAQIRGTLSDGDPEPSPILGKV